MYTRTFISLAQYQSLFKERNCPTQDTIIVITLRTMLLVVSGSYLIIRAQAVLHMVDNENFGCQMR